MFNPLPHLITNLPRFPFLPGPSIFSARPSRILSPCSLPPFLPHVPTPYPRSFSLSVFITLAWTWPWSEKKNVFLNGGVLSLESRRNKSKEVKGNKHYVLQRWHLSYALVWQICRKRNKTKSRRCCTFPCQESPMATWIDEEWPVQHKRIDSPRNHAA